MPDTFIVNQHLTFGEICRIFVYTIARIRRLRVVFLLPFCMVFVLNIILFLLDKNMISLSSVILQPFIVLLFMSAIILVPVFVYYAFLYLLKPHQFKNITYQFTHWGMEKNGVGIDFSRQWSKFLKFRETKHFILLYLTVNDAHIIQKRMFESDEQIRYFISFVSERLPEG